MRPARSVVIAAVLLLLAFSLFVIAYPFIERPDEGAIAIHWASPKGLMLRNMMKGDKIDVEYESTLPLSVYLIDRELGEEFRRPSYYRKDLPEPVHSGIEGELTLRSRSNGDLELLFWNSSFTSDQSVTYRIFVHRRVLTIGMVVSGSGLMLLSAGYLIWTFLRRGRPGADLIRSKGR